MTTIIAMNAEDTVMTTTWTRTEWVSSCPGCPYNTLEGDYEDE